MAGPSSAKRPRAKSPTPPPLPDEPLPTAEPATNKPQAGPVDQPITSLGDENEEDGDAEEDDDENGKDTEDEAESPSGASSVKGKGKVKAADAKLQNDENQPWQAVWSAEQNAWYFWNTITSEVTWTNPLAPPEATSSTDPNFQPPLPKELPPAKPEDAPRVIHSALPDIDPDLAYLLPPDQRGVGGSSADASAQSAQFNARSGKFTTNDIAYRFDALDEYNRQKRFNDHYFDVDAWQKQKDEEHAKRKRDEALGIVKETKITKKDMDRFRKKKAEQKWRKQAWLRD